MRASDYLRPDGLLASAIPGYEYRDGQLKMADAVEDIIRGEGVLMAEAGTGTGKTLAYLLPALLSDRRVVISTGTKALQDQIMDHDVPLIAKHIPGGVRVEVMKGLSNYICRRRYNNYRNGADSMGDPHLPIVEDWVSRSDHGDRKELTDVPENASVWGQVTSGSDTRIGSKCDYFEECFVTQMRRRAEKAQIVVVNHHLFFADLRARSVHKGVIPNYDAVIFDEAHQIEDVATQFFGVGVSTTQSEVLVRDATRLFRKHKLENAGAQHLNEVLRCAARFFTAVPAEGGAVGRSPLLPEQFHGPLEEALFAFDNALDGFVSFCKLQARLGEGFVQIARRAEGMRNDMAIVAEGGGGTHVTWTEKRRRSTVIGASPVDVSSILRDEVFDRVSSVVMTSATLSTSGKLDFLKMRLGIEFEIDELLVGSPFDYERQAALYLPTELPDVRSASYLEKAATEVVELCKITGGGAFVLCTSLRAMNALHQRCAPKLKGVVLLQGQSSKADLLDRFRKDGNAVLFATSSFWEGIDVQGQALRLVIIDKLPFDVPSDPLVVARCERLKEQSINPFMKYLVPNAALSLKQGFGRLIRSRKDRGIVAILDQRIVTKGYGKKFLKSLPPAKRCDSLGAVQDFWQETERSAAAAPLL